MSTYHVEQSMNPAPRTDLIRKKFGKDAIFESAATNDRLYTCALRVNGGNYVLQGETVKLKPSERKVRGDGKLFLRQTCGFNDVCATFAKWQRKFALRHSLSMKNVHIVKPLYFDWKEEVTCVVPVKQLVEKVNAAKDMKSLIDAQEMPKVSLNFFKHIEILYENYGESLSNTFELDFRFIYDCMSQLVFALLLLKHEGRCNVDISPNNIYYDFDKKLLKLFDVGDSFEERGKGGLRSNLIYPAPEFAPPEYLQQHGTAAEENLKATTGESDAYCLAMMLYTLILLTKKKDKFKVIEDLCLQKLKAKKDYEKFIESVRTSLGELKCGREKWIKSFVIKILCKALKYDPKERATLDEVAWRIKQFEEINKIAAPYQDLETEESKKSIETILNVNNMSAKTKTIVNLLIAKVTFQCKHKFCHSLSNSFAFCSNGNGVCEAGIYLLSVDENDKRKQVSKTPFTDFVNRCLIEGWVWLIE